jgi:nitrite reductase/ring-hydroxylating ferredoxin subunit/DMSO/TMAO reductase YedYZ heme-binding membrane subunit
MSLGFRAVQWNRDKLIYDAVVVAGVVIFVASFILIARHLHPPKTRAAEIDMWLRAYGSCAFVMLTVALSIGPLARLDRRFLPLLYNRRHLGVLTFLIALVHAFLMVLWFDVQNALPDLVAEFTDWPSYARFIGFPFKALGLAALIILFLMAATSHDFWLAFLTPPLWKSLHMALYVAYGLVVMHVALGIMQGERTLLIPLMLFGGLAIVTLLHLVAGWRERATDRGIEPTADGWLAVAAPRDIPDGGARIVCAAGGERIAVFRDGDEIGALSNLCAHQHGPLGEGRIIDGCVTCPWHGYQYRLADGCAPAPFTERLATYRVRVKDGVVEVDPRPLPPGTPASIRWPASAAGSVR